MKTILLMVPILLITVGFFNNAHGLSCAIPVLGDVYDESDYVFHGKVLEKNYITWDLQTPVVTFQVIESFKGNAFDQISVSVSEMWDYQFEDGFEYVVFVYREELSLRTDPCWPKFHAMPSTIEIMQKLATPEHEMHSNPINFVYESMTEKELEQFEENKKIIQEKKLKRWDSVTYQRQTTIIAFVVLIPVAATVAFLTLRKKRK